MKLNPELTNSRPEFKKIPKKLNKHYENLAAPHVNPFNEMLDTGLQRSVKHMLPVYLESPVGERIKIEVQNIKIARPQVPQTIIDVKQREIYPAESRLSHSTYAGMCTIRLGWSVDELVKAPIEIDIGEVPVMLRSKACNLYNLTPKEMVQRGEHDTDWGGIFIIRGNEKIIRMLLMTKRNYPIALKRSTWKDRGKNFSEYGIMLRCVRDDEVSLNNVLHYLKNGTLKLMFAHNKIMSYIPICLLLKCLSDCTDEELFERITQGCEDDQYFVSCVKEMIREVHNEGLHTHVACKRFVGDLFRTQIKELPPWADGMATMDFILEHLICIHLNNNREKFDLLVFMTQKLFKCVQGKFKMESVDAPMLQDVLLPGMLYQKILIDRVESWLQMGKIVLDKKLKAPGVVTNPSLIASCFKGYGISRGLETFLATGNANSRSGLGLMQSSGLVVMAECINRMRYMSHFRAVHRGSFFTTMRTTEARQLLPDAWGFICPVHTPDGTPCGLLNHLSVECQISARCSDEMLENIPKLLIELGLVPLHSCLNANESNEKTMIVLLEGKILGHIRLNNAAKIVSCLRSMKVEGKIPQQLEIGYIPFEEKGQFPGLYLFIGPGRMMREVRNLSLGKNEFIGTLEQVYMEIAVDAKEGYKDLTTHMELSKTAFLSNLANLIPMPDYNQSPRNMYQCQMGKQTMGTPCLNWTKQAATKLYRLQTPAAPLFRPVHYDNLYFDDFAMGTNAIVAVISYTGYDMEDAMIINKAAHERGFAYGSIYKSKFVELRGTDYFARNPNEPELSKALDNDGLPQPGTKLTYDTPIYSYYDNECFKYFVERYKETEEVIVDSVRYCGAYKTNPQRTVCITVRVPRPPTIGDKFASRAGQKGIFSQQYPAEDLPFTETGLIPDIVFNPHGFPSRMTIAMMIETMAGKSAALHGLVHDATPFRFSEKNTAIDYFGKLLETAGYNYYGTERLYSGVDGVEMTADIFFGIVHYQRLRHMVSDKWQVRSTGTVDQITSQPIKGRRRGGGVRFGEMERDALISHGAAYLLQDRLFHNSDKKSSLICSKCGTILASVHENENNARRGRKTQAEPNTCRLCGDSSSVGPFEIPASFRYLVAELGSVNINSRIKVNKI